MSSLMSFSPTQFNTLIDAISNSGGGGGGGGGGDLLPATATRLGGVKIGNGINVTSDGTISVSNTILEGSWNATSTSSIGAVVTSTINFPKGKYLCIVNLPTTSNDTAAVQLYVNNNVIGQFMRTISYNNSVFIIDGENDINTVNVRSASSTSQNYSNLERGYIKLVKIG